MRSLWAGLVPIPVLTDPDPSALRELRNRWGWTCPADWGHVAGMTGRSSATFVDLGLVADGDHEDDQHVIVDLVDDSVVTSTHPPLALSLDQLLGPARPRLVGEELDGPLDPPSGGRSSLRS